MSFFILQKCKCHFGIFVRFLHLLTTTDPLHMCASTASVCQQLDQLRINSGQRRGVDLGVAHSLSQWQSCMWAGICLNQLLCFPVHEPQSAWYSIFFRSLNLIHLPSDWTVYRAISTKFINFKFPVLKLSIKTEKTLYPGKARKVRV